MLGRKKTGGRYRKARKKKLFERRGQTREVVLGKEKKKKIRTLGGHIKTVLLKAEKINVYNPKEKKCKVVLIKNVIKVPSNSFLERKNALLKGAIIETELGKVRITNRPSQEGSVQGILIEE